MQYALLIYQDAAFEQEWANATDEEKAKLYAEYTAYNEMLQSRGAMVGGNELAVSQTASTVRKRNGKPIVTDGPFAEVTEQLGGYYIVEARDLDEALEFAKELPADVVEVRPVVLPEDRPES
jgi:hypothetical protein